MLRAPPTSCSASVPVEKPDPKPLTNRSSRARRQELDRKASDRRGGETQRVPVRSRESADRRWSGTPRPRHPSAAASWAVVADIAADDDVAAMPSLPLHDVPVGAHGRPARCGASQALRLRRDRDGVDSLAGRARACACSSGASLRVADYARAHELVADAAALARRARSQLRADRDWSRAAVHHAPRAMGTRVCRRQRDAVMPFAACSSENPRPPRLIGDAGDAA